MGWFLVCAAVALLGAVYLFFHARAVWRKARLLVAEVDAAAQRAQETSRPGPPPGAPGAT